MFLHLDRVNLSFVISKLVDRRPQINRSMETSSYLHVPQCMAKRYMIAMGHSCCLCLNGYKAMLSILKISRSYKARVHVNMKSDS